MRYNNEWLTLQVVMKYTAECSANLEAIGGGGINLRYLLILSINQANCLLLDEKFKS